MGGCVFWGGLGGPLYLVNRIGTYNCGDHIHLTHTLLCMDIDIIYNIFFAKCTALRKRGPFNGVLVSIIKKFWKIVFYWNTELHTCANQELHFKFFCNKRTAHVTCCTLHCSR